MFVVNPSQEEWKNGDLNLTVASTREKVIMIEAGANEVPEALRNRASVRAFVILQDHLAHRLLLILVKAIYMAHEVNQQVIAFIDKIVAECGREKHTYTSCAVPEELFAAIKELVPPEEVEATVSFKSDTFC